MADINATEQQRLTSVCGRIKSFGITPKDSGFIAQAVIKNDHESILCLWRLSNGEDLLLVTGKEYSVRGEPCTKNGRRYMIQPHIKEIASSEHASTTPRTKYSLAKSSVALSILVLAFSATAYGIHSSTQANPESSSTKLSPSATQPAPDKSTESLNTPSTTQKPAGNTQELNFDNLFSSYKSTYNTSTGTYSFNYKDLGSYLSSGGYSTSSLDSSGSATYRNGNDTWTINCSKYTNSCNAYSSSGASASTYCSRYISSCSTYGSDGTSYNTHCSQYTNSCNTYGSNGYSSSTHCSSYINNCSSYNSNGNSSSTYCSQYSNSCNTYGSDGSYSSTHCSSYTTSCNTYGSGGYSSLNW